MNNSSTTYPFFTTGYSPIPQQQQQPESPFMFSNSLTCTINDWFNQLTPIINTDALANQPQPTADNFEDILQLLPISPPLTSPGSVNHDQEGAVSTDALVALFPEILKSNVPPPRPVTAQRKPVAIMPKTSNVVPIAPRPGGFTPPASNVMKRKSDAMDSDEAAQKRQKNTDAARRSRLKKIIKMESLEKQVAELESDNARLTTRVAVLESEKSALVSKDKGLEDRIRVLEAQLAEAHRALTTKS
ncbi:hypothetical protein CU098_007088 [Rhizopus stolonifer]|uniref:BZIP domain-containing protein n=1 Tax=Rhizopus stolonifer TaxID=4846 RepID=A0A367K0I2_RHIST|nr:hypothetical protein CU098_007088 [Rhizopus stolonifer]